MFNKYFYLNILFLIIFHNIGRSQSSVIGIDPDTLKESVLLCELEDATQRQDLSRLAKIQFKLGLFEKRVRRNKEKALKYNLQSYDLAARVGDSLVYYMASLEIARTYINERVFLDDASHLLQQSFRYFCTIPDSTISQQVMIEMARILVEQGRLDQALQTLVHVEALRPLKPNTFMKMMFTQIKARIYVDQRRFEEAAVWLDRAGREANAIKNRNFMCVNKFYYGLFYYHQGDYHKAIPSFQYAIQYSTPDGGIKLRSYSYLQKCYHAIGQMQAAYEQAQKHIVFSDSLRTNEVRMEVVFLKGRHEVEQMRSNYLQMRAENLVIATEKSAQRKLVTGLSILAVLLAITGGLIFAFFKQKLRFTLLEEAHLLHQSEQKIKDIEAENKINTLRSLMEGQESERARIAKDLHDSLGGLLAQISINFGEFAGTQRQNGRDADRIVDLIDESIREVRNISSNLQPYTLGHFGLAAALRDFVKKCNTNGKPHIDFQIFGEEVPLPESKRLLVFRLLQEALNNALHHARASEILVQLSFDSSTLFVVVEDDGVGFDTAAEFTGSGLKNIYHRADILKATLNLQSKPGAGTSILAHIPL
jgi:signal transduction histidine kinase/predicted negative regulator of RcsB-dependent stress response